MNNFKPDTLRQLYWLVGGYILSIAAEVVVFTATYIGWPAVVFAPTVGAAALFFYDKAGGKLPAPSWRWVAWDGLLCASAVSFWWLLGCNIWMGIAVTIAAEAANWAVALSVPHMYELPAPKAPQLR